MKKSILIIAVVLVVLGGAFAGGQVFANYLAAKRVDATMEGLRKVAHVEYDDIKFGLINGKVRVRGIKIAAVGATKTFYIDEFILHSFKWGFCKPNSHHFEIMGIRSDSKKSSGPLYAAFSDMGYDDLKLNFECGYNYDSDEHVLDLTTMRIFAKDAGELSAGVRLVDLDLAGVKPGMVGLVLLSNKIVPKAKFASGRVSYVDDSLLSRLYALEARKKGKTADQIMVETLAEMQERISAEKSPQVVSIMEKCKQFIENPQKITVLMNPPEPLKINSLSGGTPDEQVRRLGLEAIYDSNHHSRI